MPGIAAIERGVFTDPWSARDFRDCVVSDTVFLVAEEEGGVAGYLIAHDAAGEGEILNLAVAPARLRRGIGRALVQEALAVLAGRGVSEVYLEVRETNGAARALYGGFDFREVGRRARYYRRPVEDAVVLRAVISADGGDA